MKCSILKMLLQTFFIAEMLFAACGSVESGPSLMQFSSLDLTEIESIHYDIKIDGNPLLEQTLASQVTLLLYCECDAVLTLC